MKTLKKVLNLTVAFTSLSMFGVFNSAQAASLAGIEDQGLGDSCPEIGEICIVIDNGDGTVSNLTGKATVTKNSARGTITGIIENNTDQLVIKSEKLVIPYGTAVDPLPALGFIFASLNGNLLGQEPTTGPQIFTVTAVATTFSSSAIARKIVFLGTVISEGFDVKDKPDPVVGKILGNDGILTITYTAQLGTRQKFVFFDTFEGGFKVAEPSSILSLLALGTLGVASTLKHQLKPSKSTEKEATKVG